MTLCIGKFGSFACADGEDLDEVFSLYREVAASPILISKVDGVLTAGGLGLCSQIATIASDSTVRPLSSV